MLVEGRAPSTADADDAAAEVDDDADEPHGPLSRPIADDVHVTVIQPSSGWRAVDLAELWRYRELIFYLGWRDVRVRYRQTLLGGLWAILQPVFTMVVFSVIFGGLARIPSDGVPYPIFSYCGLLPWQLFANALGQAGNSLVGNQHLITKVYFPRLAIPIATIGTTIVDFCLAAVILVGLMIYFGTAPTAGVVVLPLLILLALTTALGIGLWLSALNVKYRDIRYTIPVLTQFWLYATPVAYPASAIPEQWRPLLGLNPMAGVVEGFRWALLGTPFNPGPIVAVSAVVAAALLVTGLFYFRRMERTFADIV